jgi:molecular chaperone DnaK (HSP70)
VLPIDVDVSRYILGIDLGTLNSCVAVMKDGKAVVLGDDTGTTIPSVVAFAEDKELIGQAAKRHAVTDPQNTLVATKRLLGHPFESPEVTSARERAAYEIRPSPLGSVLLCAADRELTPVQVAARVLHKVREVAMHSLGESVEQAIISVPAHFNEVQRRATKLAAEYAGLKVLRLVNEPTAAAFAYGFKTGENFTLAVYDLGGGTFDATIMKAQGDTFEVLATDGDAYLGGEDFDNVVADWLAEEFLAEHGKDPRENQTARLRLKEAAETVKIDLTEVDESLVQLPYLLEGDDGAQISFERSVTRTKLEELTAPVLERTIDLCKRCLREARIQKEDLDGVLLVGGQTRMPAVRRAVRDFFEKEPRKDINPDEVVAMGAALYGYSLEADRLRVEAEEAAEEAYAVALKETVRARKLVEQVESMASEPVSDEEMAHRLNDYVEQAQAEYPEVRVDADLDLPAAVKDLKEELFALQLKVKNVVQPKIESATHPDLQIEHTGHVDSEAPAPKPRAEPVLGSDEDLFDKTESEFPAVAEPPAMGDAHTTAEDAEPPQEEVASQAPPPVANPVEMVSDWLERAVEASEEAGTQLDEAQEHAKARKVTLLDVTSHALGIAAVGDLLSVLIEKNATVPAEVQRLFTTHQDNQSEVHIRVFQGEEQKASRNELLGQFVLTGIEPAPRLEPKIEVNFRLDEDGILHVEARDQRTGVAHQMTVEEPLGLQQMDEEEQQRLYEEQEAPA